MNTGNKEDTLSESHNYIKPTLTLNPVNILFPPITLLFGMGDIFIIQDAMCFSSHSLSKNCILIAYCKIDSAKSEIKKKLFRFH